MRPSCAECCTPGETEYCRLQQLAAPVFIYSPVVNVQISALCYQVSGFREDFNGTRVPRISCPHWSSSLTSSSNWWKIFIHDVSRTFFLPPLSEPEQTLTEAR